MLGMVVVISIGNGAIANEVLKKTKGHALGLGFVAIAYGMAFFLAISMFGHISANVIPFPFSLCSGPSFHTVNHIGRANVPSNCCQDEILLSCYAADCTTPL